MIGENYVINLVVVVASAFGLLLAGKIAFAIIRGVVHLVEDLFGRDPRS